MHCYHYSSQTSITVLKPTPSSTTDEASYSNVSQLNTNAGATDFLLFTTSRMMPFFLKATAVLVNRSQTDFMKNEEFHDNNIA